MIQVCSSCGTRWNVRDKQRMWCPRCQGALLPPSTNTPAPAAGWHRPGVAGQPTGVAPKLPPGYRWIAVRPGAAPRHHRPRRALGPTPRYDVIPPWGLADQAGYYPPPPAPPRTGPAPALVRFTLLATAALLGAAALAHLLRYILLIINRTTLLPPLVAFIGEWSGVLTSVAAFAMMIACWVVLTRWLIARRAALFAHRGTTDPRSTRALWAGCLVPLVNLVWAPVFVVETATAEDLYARLRKPITVWWALWVLSAAVSLFAFATSFRDSAQGIADNHVATICANLVASATVLAMARVYRGFESKPVERPAHRWVVVADDRAAAAPSAAAVEPTGQEPAA